MVTVRVYAELGEFLPRRWRWQDFRIACAPGATTKHMIEAIGIPHTEVDLILVDGQAAGFDHRLRDGQRVSVYPRFTALDISGLSPLREAPPAIAFIADSPLRALTRDGGQWRSAILGARFTRIRRHVNQIPDHSCHAV